VLGALALYSVLYFDFKAASAASIRSEGVKSTVEGRVVTILEDIPKRDFSYNAQNKTALPNVIERGVNQKRGKSSLLLLPRPHHDWTQEISFGNRITFEEKSPADAHIHGGGTAKIFRHHDDVCIWPELISQFSGGGFEEPDSFKQDIGSFGQSHGIALVAERAPRDVASDPSNDGQKPIRPEWRTAIAPPGLFLLGASLLALGGLFAYRFQFISNRPEIAFAVLVGYGLAVLGVIRLLYGFFS
jgi:hypothetical protein